MPGAIRRGNPVVLQDAATGPATGLTLAVGEVESCILEVSGTYTNLEAQFEVSVDGGHLFWPVDLEPPLSTGGGTGPKMTTPGLYHAGHAFRAATHIRTPIMAPGAPSGSMTVRVVLIMW